MVNRPVWKAWLPQPFWSSLLKLLLISFLTAYPLAMVGGLLIRHWTPDTGEACYIVAVAITWWLLYGRPSRRTERESLPNGLDRR